MAFSGRTKLISQLTESTSIADSDNLIVGNTDAKKITWAQIIALIKTKLNIGSTSIADIGDGTITGAIKNNADNIDELNGKMNTEIDTDYTNGKIKIYKNGNVVTVSYLEDWIGVPVGNVGAIYNLPPEYRPANDVVCYPGPYFDLQLAIYKGGGISVYNYGTEISSQAPGRFTLTYVTA